MMGTAKGKKYLRTARAVLATVKKDSLHGESFPFRMLRPHKLS